ncbi:MAG: glycerophosphodiester phosphodiesterase family protein [Actinomycetaceae bacterium]|nr:glycerophosphodiester phosphodiesterase family protein [Actinomycetaceae bacterium]MDU0971243.1 glycerophosphodiester phosphodiesterase family protein [Actinomycetaceae bacterium]
MSIPDSLRHSRERRYPLIAAHRGTPGGIIPPNTVGAARAAIDSGADIIELDVARSRDGVYYAFHDTYEPRLVATTRQLTTLTSTEVDELVYWEHEGKNCGHIERFADVLGALPGVLVNVDRSYRHWGDGFLDELAAWGDPQTMLVKCLAHEDQLAAFAACRVDFPFMGVAHSDAEVERYLTLGDPRLVGIEIVAGSPDDPMLASSRVEQIHDAGLAIWLNAINLENGRPLAGGADDRVSLAGHPEDGWGRLADWGADIIQTDWPWLAKQFFLRNPRR